MSKFKQSKIFTQLITTEKIIKAWRVGDVQPHLCVEDTQDPLLGQSDEHDRIASAFTELHSLDLEVRGRVNELFEKHGLAKEGFTGCVHFYVRQ